MKIGLFLAACVLGISIAFACDHQECGGGNTQCCKDVWGAIYYCPPPKPPKT